MRKRRRGGESRYSFTLCNPHFAKYRDEDLYNTGFCCLCQTNTERIKIVTHRARAEGYKTSKSIQGYERKKGGKKN